MRQGEEEHRRRKAAVDYARGSVRLEGFTVTPQAEAIYASYVAGALDEAGMMSAITALHRQEG